jgi:hypothetical protein
MPARCRPLTARAQPAARAVLLVGNSAPHCVPVVLLRCWLTHRAPRAFHVAQPTVVHGDLCARNILVDDKFNAKVSWHPSQIPPGSEPPQSFVHMGAVQKTSGDHLLVFVVLLSLMVQVCLCGRRLLMLAEFASVQRAKTR